MGCYMTDCKKIRAEFHVHTRYSKDSILNKYFILLKCKINKIKVIAITDHNEIDGALKYQKFLKKYGIEVIIGEEILTKDGEIIGLYLTRKIKEGQSIEETINQIKEQGGLIYLPHPYDEKRFKTVLNPKKQKEFKKFFDFIEIHNGRNISNKFDEKQKEIQVKLQIQPIIGSDAHSFIEIGRNYIIMEKPKKETIKQCVKEGIFVEKKCIKIMHEITKLVRIIKYFERGEFNEIFRIVIKKCRRRKSKVIR